MISDWQITSMATETFWMPESPHATQKSPMANLRIAASTDSACTFSKNLSCVNKTQELWKGNFVDLSNVDPCSHYWGEHFIFLTVVIKRTPNCYAHKWSDVKDRPCIIFIQPKGTFRERKKSNRLQGMMHKIPLWCLSQFEASD